jgi:hypothetical protein
MQSSSCLHLSASMFEVFLFSTLCKLDCIEYTSKQKIILRVDETGS